MAETVTSRQILLESKVSRFLLKQRLQKVRRPYLVDAIVGKLERSEGLEVPARIYTQQTKSSR